MRTLTSALAGFALLAGVSTHQAAADVQTPQAQQTITVSAGQGGSYTVVLPLRSEELTNAAPSQTVAVMAGQGGSLNIVVPGPSVDVVAAAKAPADAAIAAKVTMPAAGRN